MSNPFWYNVNFPNDLIFSGKTTRFLRIHFTDAWTDNLIEYYVTLVPVKQNNSTSSFKINGIELNESCNYVQNNYVTYKALNVYGTNDEYNVGSPSSNPSFDTFLAPKPELWQKVRKGGQFAYRIDYDGTTDELTKFIILVSAYKPVYNGVDGYEFRYTGQIPSLDTLLPTYTEIASDYPAINMKNGIKGVNEVISNINLDENIWDAVYKIDFVELDIAGYKLNKNASRSNINELPINDNALYADKASASLIRTNPLISGNIKITADSNNDIWLNSFDANPTLADIRFKKFKLSPNSSYAADLYRFLDNGSVPSEVIFDIKEYDSLYNSTKNQYHLQYDNFYAYGVSQLNSNLYDEEFSFFAPIWLNKIIPDNFVIFRVDHPISIAAYKGLSNEALLTEFLSNAKIVKTFDLRQGTKIGTYLRNIVNHTSFTQTPLYVSFDEDTLSTWTGVSYEDGQIAGKGEYLYDVFTTDRPIKELDDYITKGFKRNSIISQNLINLEFLFDDNEADEYSINRYFGFYVNDIELKKFNVNSAILANELNQIPVVRKNIDLQPYSITALNQTNDDGISIPVIIEDMLPTSTQLEDKNKCIVIKNRECVFNRVHSATDENVTIDNETVTYRNFKLYDKTYNTGSLCGIETLSAQLPATLKDESFGQCILYLYDSLDSKYVFNPNEKLTIAWERNGEFHKWTMIANETGLQEGDWWDYPLYNNDVFEFINTFNPKGHPNNVAIAVAGCINQFQNIPVHAVAIDNKVFIITKEKFSGANAYTFTRLLTDESDKDNLKFYDLPANVSSIGSPMSYEVKTNFIGGNTRKRNRACIDFTTASNVTNEDWFQTQSNKYSIVREYDVNGNKLIALPYLDEPLYVDNKLSGFANIDTYKIIEIEDETMEFYTSNDLRISAFKVFKPSFSILSFFPVQDFDFDFYQSQYAYTPTAELLKYFDELNVNFNETLELELNEFYKITAADSNNKPTLEGFIDNTWEIISTEYAYDSVNYPYESAEPVLNSPQLLSAEPADCLFNTYTPGIFHVTDVNSQFYRRYIRGKKYEKIRIRNNSSTQVLTFEKFLYMNKNVINVNSGLENISVISTEHIDRDMQTFKGFAGLRDLLSLADESVVSGLIAAEDFSRFVYDMLISEYDRLKENYLTEWATASMVVPYINKWVSDGSDIRDNKYRFNLSSAFGATNFSPSFDVVKDPSMYTHEWLYLDEHPSQFPIDFVQNARSYMFESLSDVPNFTNNTRTWKELLSDTSTDYFVKYFSVGYPVENYNDNNVSKIKSERFTFTKMIDGINEIQTMFHGANIKIDEIDEFGNIVANSTKYEDYKFTAILTKRTVDVFSLNKLYDIEIIDNQVFKNITIVVTVFLQDHKLDKLTYAALYSINNAFKSDSIKVYTDINSREWKDLWNTEYDMQKNMNMHKFGVIVDYKDIQLQTDVEQLFTTKKNNRKLNYSLNDEYGIDFQEYRPFNAGSLQTAYNVGNFDNDGVNLPISKIISFEGFANLYYDYAGPSVINYKPSATTAGSIVYHYRKTLSYPNNPSVMYMYDMLLGSDMYNATNSSINISDKQDPAAVNTYTPVAFNDYYNMYFDNNAIQYSLTTNSTYYETHQGGGNRNIYYLNSGENYNSKISDILSFKNIADKIQTKHNVVKFVSVDSKGSYNNKFALSFIEYNKIIKTKIQEVTKDTDKPTQLKSIDTIGYAIASTDSTEVLYRYTGHFAPKMRNVIEYNLNEKLEFSNYFKKDFTLCNTSIGSSIENNAVILNHSYNKVNDKEILLLSNDSSYESKYPLIDEIAIDKKDTCIVASSWDSKYYVNNTTVNEKILVDGMADVVEIKSFFGSKTMNVPKGFNFFSFNSSEYSIKEINSIGANVSALKSVGSISSIDNGQNRIDITFNLEKRLLREMIDNYAIKELDWISANVDNSLVSNMSQAEKELYMSNYITANILNLYTYTNVVVYAKKAIKANSNQINLDTTESMLLNTGYSNYKNVKITKTSELQMTISIFVDTKDYLTYSVGIDVNRI
ncbi:MAG: hypothetical protein WC979_01530 [Candidatus Pacearchaeota archaeon]|jgi:hypothetical protein|nr:hypothetical protein [Clostridia bacterium]